MVVCRIALLDGTQFEPAGIDKNCTGQSVFDKVTQHLDVIETDYFGLTYRDKTGKKYWLDTTKKVSKQLQGGTWVFEFQVKFYPPDPMSLKEDLTRYQLCLQLRVDVFNGRLPCSFLTCALLGSYTVQAEIGDWEPTNYNQPTAYLNDFDFAPVQSQELLDKIVELHKQHRGQTPVVAEAHFLENAKKLALYGVDMHDTKDSENKDIQLGICASGILVYRNRLRIERYVWPKILKLSYKRNNFYVKIRPGEFDPHERTIGFKCETHKLAKRLWKTCVEHHAFFRLKDADAPPSNTMFPRFTTKFRYSGRTAAQARKAAEMSDREEPHIMRTAERKSLNLGHNKAKSLDEMQQKKLNDEKDKQDQTGDSNATAEYDPNMAGLDQDGKYMTAPGLKDTPDDLKEKQGAVTETTIDDVPDPAYMEQLKEDYTQLLRETPDITSTSKLDDVKHKIGHDPRYNAVPNDGLREEWFNEYTNQMLKNDFMRLLRETPQIHSQSTWPEARQEIDLDPRFQAVPLEALREEWFNEYIQNLLKSEFMQLLKETPAIHSQSRWEGVKEYIEDDPRYKAVNSDAQREAWFDEYIENMKKEEFMQLLRDTPDITTYSRYNDVKEDLSHDPRFQNVDTEAQREEYFKEYIQDLKKAGFVQLLKDTPDITAYSTWHQSKHLIDTDPRYHAVDTDLQRAKWFNEYVNNLAGIGECAYGLKVGDYKSIDRKLEFLPLNTPSVTVKSKSEEPMPFFEPAGENDPSKRKPPPVAKKPKMQDGFDEEDRQMRTSISSSVPITVETETYKFNPDLDDTPRSTSNIPIVETKTHKVTYEKDGIPYETEDSILISAHSVTTKSQTIDTTTYKTERDGVIETRVERKVTVTSDGDDDLDHDALLRAAIEEVTNMNQGLEVEKIECVKQIEEVNGK